ncbi:MAG: phage tail protein [Wolbachia endosymbiont of Alcedoecus sp.]|nr:phage tail protein [Wolbachia endosymbiont of Alcedoecus sp.]
MRINIEVTGSIEKVMQSIDAERKKTETATIRALNKTAQWLRSEGIKRVSKERKIPRKALKNKIIILKANKKRLWCRVRLISDWIGVVKLGSIKQTARGAKVGSTLYEGAFIAVMKNGHVGIFRRRCMKSLPIDEEKVKSHADEIIKELAENKVEEMFEKYFYQQMSYIE